MQEVFRTVAAMTAAACPCSSALADNWNIGAGGNSARSSCSTELGPLNPSLLWQGSLTAQVADQPMILGDVVVTARVALTDERLHGSRIVAHDLMTGRMLWNASLPVESTASVWHSRVSAIRNDLVFATRAGDTSSAPLYALSITDGSIVWRSDSPISESSTENLVFADNGDLIVGSFSSLQRIRAGSGATLWSVTRTSPSTDASAAVVRGRTAYVWEAGVQGPVVSAFDVVTGARLYSSVGIGGGAFQQANLMIAPDGTIFAPRSQDNTETDTFVALTDTGTAIVERWRRPIGHTPLGTSGVGPDGSIYMYSPQREILRISPIDGTVIDRSAPLISDIHQPRMAIGADGMVYVTNGGLALGRLYAFGANLTERWSLPMPDVFLGGPAIGSQGILVVCGSGTDVRAYKDLSSRCLVDWNTDGSVTSEDFYAFFDDFFDGKADINADGITNSSDFFGFLDPFLLGC